MKIAVIAHACRVGGGLVQTKNLLEAFKNVALNEQFLLICSEGTGIDKIELPDGSKVFVYKGKHAPLRRYWFEKITIPKLLADYKPNVIFAPTNIGLTKPNAPQAIFIRLAHLFYEKKHYPKMILYEKLRIASLKYNVKKCADSSEIIFCQTDVVKKRFAEKYHYSESRIKVLGFPPPVEITRELDKTNPPSCVDKKNDNFYMLLLTRYLAHRNPEILIPLCRKYSDVLRSKKIKFITTIESSDYPYAKKFLTNVSKYNLNDLIINVGALSRTQVTNYLYHSDVLWLPTLLECLPTPYLEAMAVGTPVLAPNLDFARYVCDDAAVYYNPWDIDSIFEKIMLLKENPDLIRTLKEKLKRQLNNKDKFAKNWDDFASFILFELRSIAKL